MSRTNLIKLNLTSEIFSAYKEKLIGIKKKDIIKQTNKNPEEFISLDQWPKTSELHCWHCTLTFQSIPKFIPKNFIQDKNIKCHAEGNFCSFNCVMSYINIHYSSSYNERWRIVNNLYKIYTIFTGNPAPPIIESSPRPYLLTKFGGNLSPDEYVELISKCSGFYNI